MPKARKLVGVRDTDLFEECRSLLRKQLGQDLPDSSVVAAALTALRTQHTNYLITTDDCAQQCTRLLMPKAAQAVTETLNLLGAARLLVAGDYEVEANPDTCKLRVLKDGVLVEPLEPPADTEAAQPEWALDLQKKMAAN